MKLLNIKREFVIGFVSSMCLIAFSATAVFATDVHSLNPLNKNTSQKAILLAKTESDVPQKDVPTYQKLMKDALDQLFAVIETIAKNPSLSQAEKELKVHQFIMSVRFGPEKKDTFFAMSIQGIMRTDVYQPDLANKDLSGMPDANGFLFIAEMIKITREQGGGFAEHLWPRYEGKLPVPSIALVRPFSQWGMIFGTRVFNEDIEAYQTSEATLFNPMGVLTFPPTLQPQSPVSSAQ